MNEVDRLFDEVRDLLKFNDYALVVKRIIDFSLDTESVIFYKKTNALLDWLDTNEQSPEKHGKIENLLNELTTVLSAKAVVQRHCILEAESLKKQYGSGAFALGPVNLKLYSGDIVGLVGENGNGKTTLLRLISGELHATSGKLEYNFRYKDLYDLRTQLVYIPQRTDVWRGSMYENLVFTASAYGYSAEENELVVELIIARLGLRRFRKHNWKDLSSGYKMRFELARMLLRKPKILLIDEPLANLDILAQQTILEDFRAIAKSPFRPVGIILSSQQLYEVEKTSDQVIFLKQGVQKNLHDSVNEGAQLPPFVVEFESEWTQSVLNDILLQHGLISLKFNGGTYVSVFQSGTTMHDFMKAILQHNIPLVYLRNISNSTRRFFVS